MTATFPSPLIHTIEPISFAVPGHKRSHTPLHLDDTAITWGGNRIPYSTITTVGYGCRSRVQNLIQRRVERRVVIAGATGVADIVFGRGSLGGALSKDEQAAYSTVVATLHELVEPRLRNQIERTMASHGLIRIGPLDLDHRHLAVRSTGERIEWRQLPTAHLDEHSVVIRSGIERSRADLAVVDMWEPNAPLLPELLEQAALTFS